MYIYIYIYIYIYTTLYYYTLYSCTHHITDKLMENLIFLFSLTFKAFLKRTVSVN